jgi:hypothetical protein
MWSPECCELCIVNILGFVASVWFGSSSSPKVGGRVLGDPVYLDSANQGFFSCDAGTEAVKPLTRTGQASVVVVVGRRFGWWC